jgi:hypothetical protein
MKNLQGFEAVDEENSKARRSERTRAFAFFAGLFDAIDA